MKRSRTSGRITLAEGAHVAVIGGGPAGAFFALHLLRQSQAAERHITLTIFERRRSPGPSQSGDCREGRWRGCNYCAGGISPRLVDQLRDLGIQVPEEQIQSRIRSLTIEGFWKNIELEIPPGREMFSVFRGSRPSKRTDKPGSFDAFLLDQALAAGAKLVAAEVHDVRRDTTGKPVISYNDAGVPAWKEFDLAVFACGVNEHPATGLAESRLLRCFGQLVPGYTPPSVRQALIFELEARPHLPPALDGAVHFVEYGSKSLPLEMCAIVPKGTFITVVLVGSCVDALGPGGDAHQLITRFLELPHVQRLIPRGTHVTPTCACRPNMVMNSCRQPFADRVVAVGDVVTARLYKDGILSAERTAAALAASVLRDGIDASSLSHGYQPALKHFELDNRYATLVFLLHRLFFGYSVLSRVLYQAVITERKTTWSGRRRLEKILWQIASGDAEYRQIFYTMLHPATVWLVLVNGGFTTLRNYLTEILFGLDWQGFGRFTTGVAIERLAEKRQEFSRLMADASMPESAPLEFERMYTIKIAADREAILQKLGSFGEPDRGYLRPRWVKIRRVSGSANLPGCVIEYEFAGLWSFRLRLEKISGGHLACYRVEDGFAKGGLLLFEIETLDRKLCALSIYVAFNFARGTNLLSRTFWLLFRALFPAFVHDVLWNHSLCQLKDLVETAADTRVAETATRVNALPAPIPESGFDDFKAPGQSRAEPGAAGGPGRNWGSASALPEKP